MIWYNYLVFSIADVQLLINISVERFLTGPEMEVMFAHRNLFPVSAVTPAETTGLFRIQSVYFIDENVWDLAPHGNGVVVGGVLVS